MCGIAGIYAPPGPKRIASVARIASLRDAMEHRGPDDSGLFLGDDGRLALGHRRLSIIDLSMAARQPMANEDGTVRLTFNGEIYNFAELRAELQRRGHAFRSRSDSEVLLHLWEDEGPKMLDRLRGMFAFAIWDEHDATLFLARDRLGLKPLYYTSCDGLFAFASEAKALVEAQIVPARLNQEALLQYLAFGRVVPPDTLFEGIRKLEPGTYMTVSRDGAIRTTRYWDAHPADIDIPANESAVVDMIVDHLSESVRLRLVSDVPLGVFLSGGVDSSLVAALAAREIDEPLRTFTLGFAGHEAESEFVYAREMAKSLGAQHSEYVLGAEEAREFLPAFVEMQDEPNSNPTWMAVYFVSRLARDRGVKVVLTGDGGDELFAGYRKWMTYLRLHEWVEPAMGVLPEPMRRAAGAVGSSFLRSDGQRDIVGRMARREELFYGGTLIKREALADMLAQQLRVLVDRHDPYEAVARIRASYERTPHDGGYLDWMSYYSLKSGLLEDFLMRLDKMGMGVSIEARAPMLDQRFVELAFAIPSSMKYPRWEAKRLLKQAALRFVPSELVNRRKQGFCTPLEDWLRDDLAACLDDVAGDDLLADVFDRDALASRIEELKKGGGDAHALYGLMNFLLWYRHWFGGSS